MKMAVATSTHHSYTLCCVIQVSTARGAGALVVARSFALAIVTMQVKFVSSKPMRIPVLGNQCAKPNGKHVRFHFEVDSRGGTTPNAPKVTSPYPQMGTIPYWTFLMLWAE